MTGSCPESSAAVGGVQVTTCVDWLFGTVNDIVCGQLLNTGGVVSIVSVDKKK